MAYIPPNPNGAATSANSSPVVIANDQSALLVTGTVSRLDSTASGSITAISQLVALVLNGKSGVALQITGTWVGTLQFEVTLDNVNWVPINGVVAGASTPGQTTSANGIVRLTPSGAAQVRVVSTSWTSGTAVISLRASDGAGGTFLNQSLTAGTNVVGRVGIDQTIPGTTNAVQVTGSIPLPSGAATETTLALINTKTPLLGQTTMTTSQPVVIASNQTAIPVTSAGIPVALGQTTMSASLAVVLANDQTQISVTEPDLFITGQGTQTVVGQNILLAVAGVTNLDVAGYRSASVQIISTGTAGTFIFENSNDGTNFQPMTVFNSGVLTGSPLTSAITATASSFIYSLPIRARFIRVRIVTTITGGALQAVSRIAQAAWSPAAVLVTQSVGGNLQTTATIASGTINTVSTITTLANGQTAHSSASTGAPVRVGGRVNTTLDTTLVQGDASDLFVSTSGQLVEKPYSTAENDWTATSGITALATNTSTSLTAAGAASIRNYVTALQLYNTSATVSTVVSILDGATVIWTGFVPATTAALPVVDIHVVFPTPLRGTASTGMNIQCGTIAANVYYNVQGYKSF